MLQLLLAWYPLSTSSWIEASMGHRTSGAHTYFILHSNYKNGRKMYVLFTVKHWLELIKDLENSYTTIRAVTCHIMGKKLATTFRKIKIKLKIMLIVLIWSMALLSNMQWSHWYLQSIIKPCSNGLVTKGYKGPIPSILWMKIQTFFFDACGMEGDFSASLGIIIQFREWHVIWEAPIQWEKWSHELGLSEFQGDF